MANKKTKKKGKVIKKQIERNGEHLGLVFGFILMMYFYVFSKEEIVGVMGVSVVGAYVFGILLYDYTKNNKLLYLLGALLGLAMAIVGSYYVFNL